MKSSMRSWHVVNFVLSPICGFGLVASATLLLGCLPCRVTGIAGRLLFSLKQRITFCLFGSISGCLLGRHALGVGCRLRCKLGLLCPFALFA